MFIIIIYANTANNKANKDKMNDEQGVRQIAAPPVVGVIRKPSKSGSYHLIKFNNSLFFLLYQVAHRTPKSISIRSVTSLIEISSSASMSAFSVKIGAPVPSK